MNITRRDLLKSAALGPVLATGATVVKYPKGKADACILLWLGGGAAHIDTFDPNSFETIEPMDGY